MLGMKFHRLMLIIAVAATIFTLLAIVVIVKYEWFPFLAKSFSGSGVTVATIILATATFWLVFATSKIVDSNNAQEKRDRKERLLNEIIDWAEDVAERTIESNLPTDDVKMTEIPERQLRRLLSQYMTLDSKSEYIACVAKSFAGEVIVTVKEVKNDRNLAQELIDAVKDMRNDLTLAQYLIAQLFRLEEIHTKLVQQSPFLRDMPEKDRKALEVNSLANAADSLRKSAINLMTKTAHIKINLTQT